MKDQDVNEPIIYAIGDVHGQAGHLQEMLDYIKAEAAFFRAKPVVYFLGDIVDRGLQSRRCLQLVKETLETVEGSILHIGNHDKWFLDSVMSLGQNDECDLWYDQGGMETIASFYPDLLMRHALEAIRRDHGDLLDMLRNASMMTVHGQLVFCHAGIHPLVPLEAHDINILTWVRGPFLLNVDAKAPIVVHGHTIFKDAPVVTENRISLDSGCYKTNKLSALRLNPNTMDIGFLQTNGSNSKCEVVEIEPTLLDRGFGTVMDRKSDMFSGFPSMTFAPKP